MMAQAATGDAEAAWESFQALSPAHRSEHPAARPRLRTRALCDGRRHLRQRPYVGRGGWSWYTGSAAWLHRAALENILGLRVQQGELSLSPCVPAHWPSFEIDLKVQGHAR